MAGAMACVGEAVRLLRRELDGKTPVLGFCGAPFTLAGYLIEGQGRDGLPETKRMMAARMTPP